MIDRLPDGRPTNSAGPIDYDPGREARAAAERAQAELNRAMYPPPRPGPPEPTVSEYHK